MVIGIDASRANNTQKTGVEWYAFFLIEELKKIVPKTVNVILYSEKPLEGELAVLPANWSSKVLRWPPRRFWTQIRMSYEMLFHAPDVLFVPAHVFPLIHPKKTVMTVHDVAAFRFPHSYNWFERWYSLWSAKYAVKNLWRVIVPSIFTKDELKSLVNTDQKNIVVVNHGFDQKFTEKKSEAEIAKTLEKYNIKKPFLLSVGRLEEKKNTIGTIHAFEILKRSYHHDDLQLILIGKSGYGGEKVDEAIRSSKFSQDIIHPGYVEQRDIPAIFQAAEMFVFPTLYEGFGIPVLEAFASGVGVITSKNTSTAEIAGEAAVLVDPEDVKSIVDAMEILMTDLELKQKIIEKGKARLKDFSWKNCAQETWKILHSDVLK